MQGCAYGDVIFLLKLNIKELTHWALDVVSTFILRLALTDALVLCHCYLGEYVVKSNELKGNVLCMASNERTLKTI